MSRCCTITNKKYPSSKHVSVCVHLEISPTLLQLQRNASFSGLSFREFRKFLPMKRVFDKPIDGRITRHRSLEFIVTPLFNPVVKRFLVHSTLRFLIFKTVLRHRLLSVFMLAFVVYTPEPNGRFTLFVSNEILVDVH